MNRESEWPDEAIGGYLSGNFNVGSSCDAGHTKYVINCTWCEILQMHLSGEFTAEARS